MKTTKDLSNEIAAFSRKTVHQKPKRSVVQSGVGRAVFHGVMVALLAISAPTGSGNTPDRSSPWAAGN